MDRHSQPNARTSNRVTRFFREGRPFTSEHRANFRVRLAPIVAMTALFCSTFATTGQANGRFDQLMAESGDYARSGLYVGGGLVGGFTTRLEDQLTDIPGVDDVEVDPSFGLAGRLGARITPHLALEAHYEWMEDFETSVDGVEIAETRTQALTGDLKGYLATGRVQPYLSAGLGFLSAKSDDPVTTFQKTDTDFAARFGGGVDFYLNESFGLSIDSSYVVPTGDVEDLDYVSVGAGVFFRF